MKRVIAMALVVLIICSTLCACSSSDGSESNLFEIETEYCNLKFPTKWENKAGIEKLDDKTDTVRFSLNGNSVFDITFGDGDTLLGTMTNDNTSIRVYVLFYEIDKKSSDYETCCAIQDDVNVITENLGKDYNFAVNSILSVDNGETFEIETPITTFYYPQRWKDIVKVEVNSKSVDFSCDDSKLFSLSFEGKEGSLLGIYDGTDIRLISYQLDDKLPEDKKLEYSAMQEDVNVILEKLYEDDKFELAYSGL